MRGFLSRTFCLFALSAMSALITMLAVAGCKRAEATPETQEIFVNACSRCHGREGTGGLPVWEGGPSPRNFHDHAFQKSRTDEEIKQTIRNGKGVGMPPFGTTFNETQLNALVTQIRSFDPEK